MDERPADGFRIAQVEQLTGVGAHTLRVWERRYGVPAPDRTRGRQRMYSLADVRLIRRMHELSLAGVPLARAAEDSKAELLPESAAGTMPMAGHAGRLLKALLAWDETAAAACWAEALESMDLLALFERVAAPVLIEIGNRWHEGSASVAQEHFATNFIRSRLEMMSRHVNPLPGAPTVLLACVEGEMHELALLMIAVLLRFQGLRPIYLGQDVPTEALLRTVEDSQPRVIALNATTEASASVVERIVPRLLKVAPLSAVVFGGAAFDENPARQRIDHAHYAGRELGTALARINRLGRSARPGGKS
ncbi:MAG: cobalamin-dependent protein [Dehalococcoidia bacterium]